MSTFFWVQLEHVAICILVTYLAISTHLHKCTMWLNTTYAVSYYTPYSIFSVCNLSHNAVYEVLDVMKSGTSSDQFMNVFHRRPVAAALYKKVLVHLGLVLSFSLMSMYIILYWSMNENRLYQHVQDRFYTKHKRHVSCIDLLYCLNIIEHDQTILKNTVIHSSQY